MTKDKIDIDKLLATDPDKVHAPALKRALEQLAKEREEREAKEALARLRAIEDHIQSAVDVLRSYRSAERTAKERLEKLVAARDAYHKTGDWNGYCEALRK